MNRGFTLVETLIYLSLISVFIVSAHEFAVALITTAERITTETQKIHDRIILERRVRSEIQQIVYLP